MNLLLDHSQKNKTNMQDPELANLPMKLDWPDSPRYVPTTKEFVNQFQKEGYVIIENAIPVDYILKIQKIFLNLMNEKVQRFNLNPAKITDRLYGNKEVRLNFKPEGGNHDLNRWNMHLPTMPEFLNEKILANATAFPVIKELLGDSPVAFILASDTPYPGAGFQNIHQDFPRFGITMNIPLVNFTEENAPLEIWPGTHIRDSSSKENFHKNEVDLSKEDIKNLMAKVPSKRCLLKMGSILIRDQRLMHRGTANTSNAPRPCLSIWYKNLDSINPLSLTIPVPHRLVADKLAKWGVSLRQKARGSGGHIQNQKLLNWGNLFGRIVEETSASDRDYRRKIPREMWISFSDDIKKLLRYSARDQSAPEKIKTKQRSILGSLILLSAGFVFFLLSCYLRIYNKK